MTEARSGLHALSLFDTRPLDKVNSVLMLVVLPVVECPRVRELARRVVPFGLCMGSLVRCAPDGIPVNDFPSPEVTPADVIALIEDLAALGAELKRF